MRNLSDTFVFAITAVALAGCGGGSDSPVAANQAEITSANAPVIAGAVMKSAFEGGEIGSFADLSTGLGGSTSQKSSGIYSKVGDVQISHTKPLLTESQIGTFEAPIEPVETACAVAGSSVVSGDMQNEEALTPNDVLSIEFIDCDDGITVVDGVMTMTIVAFSGDFSGGSVNFEVAVELNNFSVTQDGMTQTADGDIRVGMSLPNAGPITMAITSDSLVFSDGTTTRTLTDYSLTQTIDPDTNAYSLTVSGTIDSSAFEGSVSFSTGVDLSGTGSGQVAAGEIVVSGDADATIRIVILDASLIRLDVDDDGDGVVDTTIDTSRDELI